MADDWADAHDHADHPYYNDPLRQRHPRRRGPRRATWDSYGGDFDHDSMQHDFDDGPGYVEPHPLDHLEGEGLSGEEMHTVREMLHNMHIHDAQSADQSIMYLNSHVKEMKEELAALQNKSVELGGADKNLAKADGILQREKQKISDKLQTIIAKNEEERRDIEQRALKRRETYEGWDKKFRKLEEGEIQ